MDEFFDSTNKYEIKIFQIDRTFYEFRDFHSAQQIIQQIVDEHRKSIDDNNNVGMPIPLKNHDGINYFTYVYNEEEKDSYWASFLPSDLVAQHSFTVQQLSLVLFAEVGDNIFVLVGGTGIRVILRYINHRFGLELYEYMADPSDDVINFITTRGISGNLSENKRTFRDGQKLSDSLNFTNIPTRINLVLREELKNTVFDFIDFSSEKVYVEIASYFCIKVRVSFEDLHKTFISIDNVLNSVANHPLTSFVHVKDKNVTEIVYRMELYFRVRQDMFDRLTPSSALKPVKFDIDFVHPSKLQDFYECDRYELFERNAKTPFFTTNNRNRLYFEGLRWLFDNYSFDFNYTLSGIRVTGYKGNQKKTNAMFTQHITCEINVNARPIFLIDANWYKVNNDFIDTINRICTEMLNKNYLKDNILTIPWSSTITEGAYNLLYESIPNFRVFDKVISQNIELCDLYFEDDNSIYLIHVKNGFDAKIRDVSNQIVISSARYWNDKNSGSYDFLNGIIDSYNALPLNVAQQIIKGDFISKFSQKEVLFVMAFNSTLSTHQDIRTNIHLLRSNIAKYSLIQCVRDMNTEMYPVKIFDIACL